MGARIHWKMIKKFSFLYKISGFWKEIRQIWPELEEFDTGM